jgi:hypothetical protein
MKNEEKSKSKKKKVLKILLGIGAVAGAAWLASKCVPRFNTKVIVPIKNIAETAASDIKEAAIKEAGDQKQHVVNNNQRPQFPRQENQSREINEKVRRRRPSFQDRQRERRENFSDKKERYNNKQNN